MVSNKAKEVIIINWVIVIAENEGAAADLVVPYLPQ